MQKDISYQLNRVDLNLLVAFDCLLRERNQCCKSVICFTVSDEPQFKTFERDLR